MISISNLARTAKVNYRTARRWVRGERVAARSQRRLVKAFVELGGQVFDQ
jgi:hypothetical protein